MAFENLKKSGIQYVLTKLKDVFLQIKDAVRSVNGNEPDENGDITVTVVPYAQNLQSESSQRNVEEFIERTAGGTTSIENGDAWLMTIKGNSIHEDYVAEELNCQAYPVDPDSPTAISVEIDHDTFVQEVSESGTITLLYANDWSTDPAVYGVTVTGTPANGDTIVITYVAEERGTITVANPHSMLATGWNLYNHDAGYARALKYSDVYGFRISGTYTALKYSATISGTKADIVVTDGAFDVPADGYIWVTGGNSTDTAIWMAWSDWGEGYVGDFTTYVEDEIDLTSVMSTYFPYGLCKAGTVQDEIDLNIGQAISRVEVLTYSEANRASAEASGREYEFDENYIYLARSSAVINNISIDGGITVDDHGLEIFTNTDVSLFAQILYGNNLKNKLERDVLQISQQNLTEAQQAQVRENIGAVSSGAFSDLSTFLSTSKHNITFTGATGAGSAGTTNIVYRFGNVVFVFLDFNVGSSAISAFTPFAKCDIEIPEAFEINAIVGVAQTGTSIQNEYLRATKNASNQLCFSSSVQLTANKRYRGSGAFIIP